jgi:peptidoglycan-associated lipoprotein
MRITTSLVFVVAGLFIFSGLHSQTRRIEKAERALDAGEYYEAIDLYRDAYSRVKDRDLRTEITFIIAKCYMKVSDARQSESWFRRAVTRSYSNPEVHRYFGEALKMNEKYEEALEQFRIYKELVPDDPRGDIGIESCELAMHWMENPTSYQIEEMTFFNSRQSDFSPAFASGDHSLVYFTSSRENDGNELHGATGQYFSNIYEARRDRQGEWNSPVPVAGVNSEFDEGTPSFNREYSVMYFTSCKAVRRMTNGCQIYYAQRQGNQWSRPEVIDLAPDTLIAAHPAISPDELTLYFVSDMPGGEGGKDLWKVTRNSLSSPWSDPVNLGPEINTPGDEVFPYVRADETLYFSSNGHPGMGGLDIFRASETSDGGWKIENMGYPVNSPADDFGIVFQGKEERGLFSSNRGRQSVDNIYSFYLPPLAFNVGGRVLDVDTEEMIPGSTVRMVGSDGTMLDMNTGDNGRFRFMLRPDVEYVLLASKSGYLTDKRSISTIGLAESKDFSVDIDIKSHEKPIELPDILYDFARWDLRPESMVALDGLVETLNNNPNITIELASHTDARGGEAHNLELSQKRAQSVVNYLIENGIAADRLVARGYGKSRPRTVDSKLSETFEFLPEGTVLTEEFIESLPYEDEKEEAHQVNRRTEFEVISTDYQEE